MKLIESEGGQEELSEAQAKFVEIVKKLAINEGGPRGVNKSGIYPAFPGVSILTYITHADQSDDRFYSIGLYTFPEDYDGRMEEIWIDIDAANTTYAIAEGYEPFEDQVPDEVIESFIERYKLYDHAARTQDAALLGGGQ